MVKPIAQFLLAAMLCLPAQASELYRWIALNPPVAAPTGEFVLAGQKKPTTLAAFKGSAVLINFWATWCTPCLKELPSLAELQRRRSGLQVIALSVDAQPFDVVQGFLRKKNIRAPRIGHDPQGVVYEPLGKSGLPLTYLMNREGMLTHYYEGATDWAGSEHAKLLNEALR